MAQRVDCTPKVRHSDTRRGRTASCSPKLDRVLRKDLCSRAVHEHRANSRAVHWPVCLNFVRRIQDYFDEGKSRSVGKFVTVKAPENFKIQQFSTSGLQQVPYESLAPNRFPQVSVTFGIWFGTRGSEVQILSPRPIFSIRYSLFEIHKNLTVGKFVTVKSSQFHKCALR